MDNRLTPDLESAQLGEYSQITVKCGRYTYTFSVTPNSCTQLGSSHMYNVAVTTSDSRLPSGSIYGVSLSICQGERIEVLWPDGAIFMLTPVEQLRGMRRESPGRLRVVE